MLELPGRLNVVDRMGALAKPGARQRLDAMDRFGAAHTPEGLFMEDMPDGAGIAGGTGGAEAGRLGLAVLLPVLALGAGGGGIPAA
jgi:hypothetical protein